MINGLVTTLKTQPNYDGKFTILRDLIQNGEVTSEFYIDKNDLDKWAYLKGPKKEMRTNAQGFGLGFERLILFVTGMTNIRDVIPFPRAPKNAEF